MPRLWTLCILAAMATAIAACGGDGDDDDEPDATARPGSPVATRRASTPAAGATQGAAGATRPAAAGTAAPAAVATAPPVPTRTTPPPPAGKVYTQAEATAFLEAVLLSPADLPGAFSVNSDTTNDNAAAAALDPVAGASFERCGRLLSRQRVNNATEIVSAYISGQTVSFFSQATVYATAAGAQDCAAESSVRFQNSTELAKAFTVFVDPTQVVVATVDFPRTGDGSRAVTLTGQVLAQGNPVNLTILAVLFLRGNSIVVVGSAASAAPTTAELVPLVNLVLQRVDANR